MSGGKRLLLLLSVLFLALLPLYCSEDDFLTELEKELTTLDNSLMKLESLSEGQRSELENLSALQLDLQGQVSLLQTQLKDSQNQVTILKTQSEKLGSQLEDLEASLKQSEKEMNGLRIRNWLLVGGIGITFALSLVAVIFVAAK